VRRRGLEKITLPLGDLRDLFSTPEFDPVAIDSAEAELNEPGIDYLTSLLRGRRLAGRAQLVLQVTPAVDQPADAGRASRAIDRYCRHKILESKRTLKELLWTGLKALQIGTILLAAYRGLSL
jgi:hypothetical protein